MPPLCDCHGKPKRWINDSRYTAGGYWRCKIKDRDYERRNAETRNAWARDRYARDPIARNRTLLGNELARQRRLKAARPRPSNPRVAAFLVSVRTGRS